MMGLDQQTATLSQCFYKTQNCGNYLSTTELKQKGIGVFPLIIIKKALL